jgi:hypothetical protein
MGLGGQRHTPAALSPVKRPGIHFTGGWLGPRVGMDECRKSRPPPPSGIRFPERPARSESRYID